MQPGSLSFLHFSPLENWLRLVRCNEKRVRTIGTVFLVLVIVLHTTLGHLAFFDAQTIAARTVTTRPFRLPVPNTTVPLQSLEYMKVLDSSTNSSIPSTGPVISVRNAMPPGDDAGDRIVKILLVTYYRSGYNMIGGLLEGYPGSFYWSEPLYGLYNAFYKKSGARRSMVYNGYDVKGIFGTNQTETLHELAITTIVAILNCDMKSLPSDVIQQNYLYTTTNPGVGAYKSCLHQYLTSPASERNRQCLPLLENGCHASNIRSVKTTRLSLSLVLDLMSRDRDLKVIYVVRDPRLMMRSRSVSMDLLPQILTATCSAMYQDIQAYREIYDSFPQHIFLIKSEDVATDPLHWSKEVLTFTTLQYNEDQNSNIAAPQRSDVNSVVKTWTQRFTPRDIMNMQIDCQDVFSQLDYNIVYV